MCCFGGKSGDNLNLLKNQIYWLGLDISINSKILSYLLIYKFIKPWHEISNNVVCATNKAPDQPAHTRSLIRAFASRLNVPLLLSYWSNIIWSFYCTGSSASPLVKMSHFWKSRFAAHLKLCEKVFVPRREKTCLRGFRQSEFETFLPSYWD